jgi:hypothetical protein
MEIFFPSETVSGETAFWSSARTKEYKGASTRTEQHTTLASSCTVIRLILREKIVREVGWKRWREARGDKEPSGSRLTMDESKQCIRFLRG